VRRRTHGLGGVRPRLGRTSAGFARAAWLGDCGQGRKSTESRSRRSQAVYRRLMGSAPRILYSCGTGGNDVVDDVLGIPSHTAQQRRAERVEEGQPHEVETGTGLDDAPIVNGYTVTDR